MSNSNINETKTKKKLGRPITVNRTPKEKKEYMRERSRLYYSDPKNKAAQVIRANNRVNLNRALIYEKNNKRRRLITFEKRLKKIWISRGLINTV